MVAHERARGARMIEMDVRQQQRRDVGHRDAGAFELASKHRKGARWSGIDQRHAAFAVQHPGGDDARHAPKQQIDVRESGGEGVHRSCRPSRSSKGGGPGFRFMKAMPPSTPMITNAISPLRPIQRSSVSQLYASE